MRKAGCVQEAVIKQALFRGREILPRYWAGLSFCCSSPVPWTIACALCFPGLLLLLQVDPSASISTLAPDLPTCVMFQKKKKFLYSCFLSSAVCLRSYCILINIAAAVVCGFQVSQQQIWCHNNIFVSIGWRPGQLLSNSVPFLVEAGLEGWEVCYLKAKPEWQLTRELGTRH